MGNTLCKQPNSKRSPGNGFSGFTSVICPSGLGKGKTPMKKTYFTRSAVDASHKASPGDNGWQTVGLNVPDGGKVIDTPPVAPPRKKRGSTIDRRASEHALKVKNGFREVFGSDSRRHSYDMARDRKQTPREIEDEVAVPVRQVSCFEIDAHSDAFSDFSKVPTTAELEREPDVRTSRVGNRKSDKVLGESLSGHLAQEQAPPAIDTIDKFVEQHVPKQVNPPAVDAGQDETELLKYIDAHMSENSQLGKKAEFLMAMLEDYNGEHRYDGMKPVEEPLIVPKRRKSRHICDDEDHLHEKLHEHEKDAVTAANLIKTEASIEIAPKKPDRDFSRYKSSENLENATESEETSMRPPSRKKQPVSKGRENLPQPPLPPKFHKSFSEVQFSQTVTSTPIKRATPEPEIGAKVHSPRMLQRIISMPVTEHLAASCEPQPGMVKSTSSSSFSNVDLHRARIGVTRFTPEDFTFRNTADELVQPKSKLITRKPSNKSLELPSSPPPTPSLDPSGNGAPRFTIGGSMEIIPHPTSPHSLGPPEVPKRKRSGGSDLAIIGEKPNPGSWNSSNESLDEQAHKILLGHDLGSFIDSSKVLQHHDVVSVLESIYDAGSDKSSIIKEFHSFLEDQINAELNEPNPVNPNVSKLLEKISHNGSEHAAPLANVTIDLVESDASSNSSTDIDDCFDPEFEKIEKHEILSDLPLIGQPGTGKRTDRRNSIEYMKNWFSHEVPTEAAPPPPVPKRNRAESIEDVGTWFSHHLDSPGDETPSKRRLRRGSDGFLAYDTSRQYPFGKGRQRCESHSAELFENITELHELGRTDEDVGAETNDNEDDAKLRTKHRRGSDGLIFYDTTRKFPFGEPNVQLPKALEKLNTSTTTTSSTTNNETPKNKEENEARQEVAKTEQPDHHRSTDHSTLLKYLSKENLVD